MRDSQSLIKAILDDTAGHVSAAVAEARRTQHTRKRRRVAVTAAALVAVALASTRMLAPSHPKLPPEPVATAAPGLRIFTTDETNSRFAEFSTPANAPAFAQFVSADQTFRIRTIDDNTLLELLKPYGPAIVYLGADRHPSLLLLDDRAVK